MRMMRPAIAVDSRSFGKRFVASDCPAVAPEWAPGDDLKLFAGTFVAGFLFVSILIG